MQQHQHDIALLVFVSVFSPRLLTSEEPGSDGWDGVTRLQNKSGHLKGENDLFSEGHFHLS